MAPNTREEVGRFWTNLSPLGHRNYTEQRSANLDLIVRAQWAADATQQFSIHPGAIGRLIISKDQDRILEMEIRMPR
jgi:hypothetical protein